MYQDSFSNIHLDEIILEYRVNHLRSQVRDLESQRERLDYELDNLRVQKYELLNQVLARQCELDVLKRDLEYERFSNEILKDVFREDRYYV
jgi:hypothetical protein